jgi:peptidyl-prolyl cis-trans isomerase SurA
MSPKFPALSISPSTAVLAIAVAVASVSLAARGQNAHSIPAPAVAEPQSPFAGTVVEEPIAFVNDQIISKSDYERQTQELEATARQQNWTAQQLEEQKKNLLRDMVDQQLLISKGKELGITGETEMIKQLDAIRKQNNLDSMEALEAAAKQQGVSFEDFKQHIRDRVITQQVIGQEVYRKVNLTQADIQKYYEAHKAEYDRPESVRLSEILIPTGATPGADDAAQVAAAQAKAQEVYSKLQGGAKFDDLAKTASAGTTAAQGGDLGEYKRGQLAKVLEDQTFSLKTGQYTQPIRTKQGFVILYVANHTAGGIPPLKDVLPQVEEAIGAERTEPALRAFLKQLREEAYIEYKPGYVDTAAVVNPSKPTYSAYAPPAVKKKKKVQRTRFRQRTLGSAPRTNTASAPAAAPSASPAPAPNVPSLAQVPGAATANRAAETGSTTGQAANGAEGQVAVANPPSDLGSSSTQSSSAAPKAQTPPASSTTQKPGKKEKIRYGQAPTKTLPASAPTQTVDAGATGAAATADPGALAGGASNQVAMNNAPDLPGEATPTAPEKKTRFSDRVREPKEKKTRVQRVDPFAPQPISAEEVADRQTQSAPLGLAGDTTKKKTKPTEKTRLQDEAKKPTDATTDANPPATTPAPETTPPAAQPQ